MSSIPALRPPYVTTLICAGFLCTLLGTSVCSHAAIGETREELARRYGAGKEVGSQMLYKVENYSVSVYFDDKKSSMEIYARITKVDGTREELTPDDIQNLLRLQGGNSQWNVVTTKKGDKTWSRQDGKVIARLKPAEKALVFVDALLK